MKRAVPIGAVVVLLAAVIILILRRDFLQSETPDGISQAISSSYSESSASASQSSEADANALAPLDTAGEAPTSRMKSELPKAMWTIRVVDGPSAPLQGAVVS